MTDQAPEPTDAELETARAWLTRMGVGFEPETERLAFALAAARQEGERAGAEAQASQRYIPPALICQLRAQGMPEHVQGDEAAAGWLRDHSFDRGAEAERKAVVTKLRDSQHGFEHSAEDGDVDQFECRVAADTLCDAADEIEAGAHTPKKGGDR